MEEAQALIQQRSQDTGGGAADLLIALHLDLGNLHIPVAIIRPEELVDLATGLTKLEIVDETRHAAGELLEAAEDPAIGQCARLKFVDGRHATADLSSGHQYEARGIPDLVGE